MVEFRPRFRHLMEVGTKLQDTKTSRQITFISHTWLELITTTLKARREILFAMLYGSATETSKFHDLDIGLYIDRKQVSVAAEIDFAFDLAEQLTQQLSFAVDVRVINNAPLGFRYNVSQGQPVLIHDPETYYHFLERTWDTYLDFEPVARQYLKEIL